VQLGGARVGGRRYPRRMAIATQPTDADVTAFLDAVPDERRRADGHTMRALMERVTGEPAVMWGPAIVGFGAKSYSTKSETYDMLVLGFSPRKASLTLYGIFDETEGPTDPLFAELGPHETSQVCLYLKKLDAVNANVLEQLIRSAWERSA
jgi:hypothetical protein